MLAIHSARFGLDDDDLDTDSDDQDTEDECQGGDGLGPSTSSSAVSERDPKLPPCLDSCATLIHSGK